MRFITSFIALLLVATSCKSDEIANNPRRQYFGEGTFEAKLNGKNWKGVGDYYYEEEGDDLITIEFQCDEYKFNFDGAMLIRCILPVESTVSINEYDFDSSGCSRVQIGYFRYIDWHQFINSYESIKSGEIIIERFDSETGELIGRIKNARLLPKYQEGDTVNGWPVYVEMEAMYIEDFHFTIYETIE